MDRALIMLCNQWEAYHLDPRPDAEKKEPSIRAIARMHGLVHTTVQRRSEGTLSNKDAHIIQQRLSPGEEAALREWILQLAEWGWPARVSKVKKMAEEILHERKDFKLLGPNWVAKFLSRYDDLKTRFSQPLDKERAAATSPETVQRWFDLVARTIKDYNIRQEDVYNMDEKGYAMGIGGKAKVVVSRHDPYAFQTQCGSREWVSTIECISADGRILNHFLIFKGVNYKKDWFKVLENGAICMSDTGWTNNAIGMQWFEKIFDRLTPPKGEFRLLFMDGHDSHIQTPVIRHCVSQKIIPLCLPPHTTHILQPLDVVFFQPLAQAYRRELEAHTNFGADYHIDKCDFIKLYQAAKQQIARPEVIASAWAKAGLFPLEPSIVLDKLPKRRQITPPQQLVRAEDKKTIYLKTPNNAAEVMALLDGIREHQAQGLALTGKLAKACIKAMTESSIARLTNDEIIKAQKRKKQRADRTHEHYGDGMVLTLEMAEARDTAKKDENMQKDLMKAFKSLAGIAPDLFNENLSTSPRKRIPTTPAKPIKRSYIIKKPAEAEAQAIDVMMVPPLPPGTVLAKLDSPAKEKRQSPSKKRPANKEGPGSISKKRRTSKQVLFQEIATEVAVEVMQKTRSGRTVRPKRLD